MQSLLILGCGEAQAKVIIEAQKLGFEIIGIDKNPNSFSSKIVNKFICASTHSYKELTLNPEFRSVKKLDGILIKSSGIPVLTSSKIAKKFNIPFISPKSVEISIYKNFLKDFCKNRRIPTTRSITLSKLPSKRVISKNEINFPVLLRPAISIKGKSGIYLINKYEDLDGHFKKVSNLSLNKKVILDEYLDGIDYQIFGFVENSKFHQYFILEEMNFFGKDSKLYNLGFRTISHPIIKFKQKKINKFISSLIKGLSIKRSPLIISLRQSIKDKNFFLVELHLDLGGEKLLDKFIPEILNIDYVACSINASVGNLERPKNIKVYPKMLIFNNPANRSKGGYKIYNYNSFFELNKSLNILKKIKYNHIND